MGDLLFHGIKPEYKFFIARDPVNNRICHVLEIFGLLLAHFNIYLSLFLKPKSELSATCNPLPAELEALVRLLKGLSLRVIKAVHTTAGRFVVHYVELLIEESEESNLPILHALVKVLKYLLVHMCNSVFVIFFAKLEEVSQLLLTFGLRIKVHVKLLLEILPSSCVFSFPPMQCLSIEVKRSV